MGYKVRFFFKLLAIIILTSGGARAETLNDCLLDNLKGVSSDIAANAIKDACAKKYGAGTDSKNGNSLNNANQVNEIVLTLNKRLFSSKIPEYRIPVPSGNWQKIGERKDHKVQPPMHTEIWVNVVDNEVHNFFYVNYNKASNQNGWKPNKTCNRKNLHFVKNYEKNKGGGNQNCLIINHLRMTGGADANKAIRESKEWAKSNNIRIPTTAIIHQHHFANKKYLDFWIGYNPEIEGFPQSVDATWNSNDWHQDRIIGNQERQEYIQKILAFGKQTHAAVVSQFEFK